jgi:hypothetical protein
MVPAAPITVAMTATQYFFVIFASPFLVIGRIVIAFAKYAMM